MCPQNFNEQIQELFKLKKFRDRRDKAVTKLWPHRFKIIKALDENEELLWAFCCCEKSFNSYSCKRRKVTCCRKILTWSVNLYFLSKLIIPKEIEHPCCLSYLSLIEEIIDITNHEYNLDL